MKPTQHLVLFVAAISSGAASVGAAELGDPAPALQIAEWVKGEPVVPGDEKAGKICVIEFWAAADGICRQRIPRLTEIQKKYAAKEVVIVAVSPEMPDFVRRFVEQQGEKIGYRVAVDKNGATLQEYAKEYYFRSVPRTFVIDKAGKVLWLGFNLDWLETTLDAVLAGTYDLEAARRSETARRAMVQYFVMVKSITKASQAAPVGRKVLEYAKDDMHMLNSLAWGIATEPGLFKRDLDLAFRAAQRAYEICEGKHPAIVDTYARVLWESGRKKEALEHQKKAVELAQGQELEKELKATLEKYQAALGE